MLVGALIILPPGLSYRTTVKVSIVSSPPPQGELCVPKKVVPKSTHPPQGVGVGVLVTVGVGVSVGVVVGVGDGTAPQETKS